MIRDEDFDDEESSDRSVARDGVCRADRKSRAICQKGKYVIEPCRGPDGCTMQQGGMSTCDHAVTKLGDRCTVDARLQMCGEDGKSFTRCLEGAVVLVQKCPGPNGCKDEGGGRVACDPNGAFLDGDLCHFLKYTCTQDQRALLMCESGKFVKKKTCPGPGGCNGLACDQGTALAGDPCNGKEACSEDGKSLLACKPSTKKTDEGANVWTLDKKCKTACTVADGKLLCE